MVLSYGFTRCYRKGSPGIYFQRNNTVQHLGWCQTGPQNVIARLQKLLSSCRDKVNNLNTNISQYPTDEWNTTVSDIKDSLESIESRLENLSPENRNQGNIFVRPRRRFRRPYDLKEQLSGLITDVQHIVDIKISFFRTVNNAAKILATGNASARQRPENGGDDEPGDDLASAQVQTSTLDIISSQYASPTFECTETTTAFSMVANLARSAWL